MIIYFTELGNTGLCQACGWIEQKHQTKNMRADASENQTRRTNLDHNKRTVWDCLRSRDRNGI